MKEKKEPKGPGRTPLPTTYTGNPFAHNKQIARYGKIVDPLLDHHLSCLHFYYKKFYGDQEELPLFKDIRITHETPPIYPLHVTENSDLEQRGLIFSHKNSGDKEHEIILKLLIRSRVNFCKYMNNTLSWNYIGVFEDISNIWKRLTDPDWVSADPTKLSIIRLYENRFPEIPKQAEFETITTRNTARNAIEQLQLCFRNSEWTPGLIRRYKKYTYTVLSNLLNSPTPQVTDIPDIIRYVGYADKLDLLDTASYGADMEPRFFLERNLTKNLPHGEQILNRSFYLTPEAHSAEFREAISNGSGVKFHGLI